MRHSISTLPFLIAGMMHGVATAAPKGLGEMTREEVRDEVHSLYRDELPYAMYIKRLTVAADSKWATLTNAEKTRYEVHVYARLMDALRLLRGATALPDDAIARRYQATVSLSLAIDGSKLAEEYEQFYKDVFQSNEFNSSNSAFKAVVIDLWTRYERDKKLVPYTDLLLLNQAGMGHPNGQDGDGVRSQIATMYAELGDHVAEAKWYEGVSPAGLGPIKSADALFLAERYDEAAERYQNVLGQLDAWAKLKPRLKHSASAEPLEFADLEAIREKAEVRLKESIRRRTNPTTRNAS